jgi:hypothetical protein
MSDPRLLVRQLIRTFFPDYLRIVETDSAGKMRLDLITFPTPDKISAWIEDDQNDPAPNLGADLRADLRPDLRILAEVPSRRGEFVTVLVHVETEAQTPPEAARRLGCYLTDLELRYGQPVLLSVVYLRGGRGGVHLESATLAELCGIELVRIFYTAFCLEDARAEYYLERPEPLAWALSALMRPLRRSPEEHRRVCLERIAATALDEERRALLRQGVEVFGEVVSAAAPPAVRRSAGRARG